jgi:hypothetical protein
MKITRIFKVIYPAIALLAIAAGCSGAYSSSTTSTTTSGRVIQVISVASTGPINPGGPVIEVTLKNISGQNIVALTAILTLAPGSSAGPFTYDFGIGSSLPLAPGATDSQTKTLIGASYSAETPYPLGIHGNLQDGASFTEEYYIMISTTPSTYPP